MNNIDEMKKIIIEQQELIVLLRSKLACCDRDWET